MNSVVCGVVAFGNRANQRKLFVVFPSRNIRYFTKKYNKSCQATELIGEVR